MKKLKLTQLIPSSSQLNWQSAYDFCERYNSSLAVLNDREKIVKMQLFLVKNSELIVLYYNEYQLWNISGIDLL